MLKCVWCGRLHCAAIRLSLPPLASMTLQDLIMLDGLEMVFHKVPEGMMAIGDPLACELPKPTMKMTEGLATSSTPMVRRLRCSTLSPLTPGTPTSALRSGASSISSSTCARHDHASAAVHSGFTAHGILHAVSAGSADDQHARQNAEQLADCQAPALRSSRQLWLSISIQA